MKTLIKKELSLLLCSPIAVFFAASFLLAIGFILWVFPGSYNILDEGYASLSNFFKLAPILFIILIPALTMRSFSDEKKTQKLDVFRTQPKSILALYISKLLSLWTVIVLVLLSTGIYPYTLYIISNPVGNIDVNEILSSYVCLLFFTLIFIAIGLFASSLTKSQIVAFIISIFLNFFVFYGFELLSSLFSENQLQLSFSSIGLFAHYESLQKGVIHIKDILLILSYTFLFSILSIYVLCHKNTIDKKAFSISLASLLIINLIVYFTPDHRFDFTSDKRYTVNNYTKEMLEKVSENNQHLHVKVYLEGDINPGFQKIQNAIKYLLTDLKKYSNNISYEFINPNLLYGNHREAYEQMQGQHMHGIVLNEVDREGKTSQKIIYPYAQVFSENDTIQINLLKNIAGYSAEENINASIENLEFEFVDAIRLHNKADAESIAFIEGHGEIARTHVYDAEELLSKYFFVNRGQIGNDISALSDFKVVIIAGPTEDFSESEKYILDQYIMSGGRILWLIDGVYLSQQELEEKGQSPSMKNDVNLDDLLFTYGVRINSNLIQDIQCTSIYLTSGEEKTSNYIQQSWYYAPLLLPSFNNVITKDISLIKGTFSSSINTIDKSDNITKKVLLTSSAHSHIVEAPEMIQVDLSQIKPSKEYFNQSFLPVAIALHGSFKSAFENRMIPDSVNTHGEKFTKQSAPNTKMIVISSSSIIRNEIVGHDEQTQILPMGFDRVSEYQYGNRDFIVNSVNWLANDDAWFSIRLKQQQMRLLNKQLVYSNRNLYEAINIIIPIIFSLLLIGGFYLYRKRKYEK